MLRLFYRFAGRPLVQGALGFAVTLVVGLFEIHRGVGKPERVLPLSLFMGAFVVATTHFARWYTANRTRSGPG